MDGVIDAIKEMEEEFRILSASEMEESFNPPSRNDESINMAPLQKLVFSPLKFHTTILSAVSFREFIPEAHRALVLTSAIRLCCFMSTVWGVFFAHEEPNFRMLLQIIQRLSCGELPDTVLGQHSSICTRSGLILGWNCAMHAVKDVFQDRLQ